MDTTFATLLASALRHGLTIGAGFLVAKGVISDAQGPELVGIAMAALAYGWSVFKHTSMAAKLRKAIAAPAGYAE
jgi:hypothetical protein